MIALDGEQKIAVLHLSAQDKSRSKNTSPLVLLGGTSQVINSWIGHHRQLSKERNLINYELRGQGRHNTLNLNNVSIPQHIKDFENLIVDKLRISKPVDLCGFSFGGRVALAIAAKKPNLVRRVVLTGVPLTRNAEGRLIFRGWLNALVSLRLISRIGIHEILTHFYNEYDWLYFF